MRKLSIILILQITFCYCVNQNGHKNILNNYPKNNSFYKPKSLLKTVFLGGVLTYFLKNTYADSNNSFYIPENDTISCNCFCDNILGQNEKLVYSFEEKCDLEFISFEPNFCDKNEILIETGNCSLNFITKDGNELLYEMPKNCFIRNMNISLLKKGSFKKGKIKLKEKGKKAIDCFGTITDCKNSNNPTINTNNRRNLLQIPSTPEPTIHPVSGSFLDISTYEPTFSNEPTPQPASDNPLDLPYSTSTTNFPFITTNQPFLTTSSITTNFLPQTTNPLIETTNILSTQNTNNIISTPATTIGLSTETIPSTTISTLSTTENIIFPSITTPSPTENDNLIPTISSTDNTDYTTTNINLINTTENTFNSSNNNLIPTLPSTNVTSASTEKINASFWNITENTLETSDLIPTISPGTLTPESTEKPKETPTTNNNNNDDDGSLWFLWFLALIPILCILYCICKYCTGYNSSESFANMIEETSFARKNDGYFV